MRIVIFGLTVSSTWGNGHAALWRGMVRALASAGVHVTFFERNQSFYADNRDLSALPHGGDLVLYDDWASVRQRAQAALTGADAALVTSYCPDGIAATELLLESSAAVRCFYDMDTPVTLARLQAGETLPYIGPHGLSGFEVVFSYTGGAALDGLRRLGARRALPLYGWVDPVQHHPSAAESRFAALLSYIGTFAADRQHALETLLIKPARRRPADRFVIAGAQYPQEFPWADNIWFVRHLPPAEHSAFYASSRLTLNITRAAMAKLGWCPSGRLFEAAACGTPVLSDVWDGLDNFFRPDEEILLARNTEEALAALDRSPEELRRVGICARERALAEHTAEQRARELLAGLEPRSTNAEAA